MSADEFTFLDCKRGLLLMDDCPLPMWGCSLMANVEREATWSWSSAVRHKSHETTEEGSAEGETRDDDDGASGSHAASSSLRRIRSNQSSSSQLSSEKTDGVSKASLVASDDLAEGRETADSGTATGVQGKVAENVITKEKAAKDDDLDEELQADVDQAKAAVLEDSKKNAKSSVARSRSYPKTPLPMSSSRRIRSYQPSSSKQPSKDGNDVVLTMLGNLNKKTATETATKKTAATDDDAFPDDEVHADEKKAEVGEVTQEKLPEDAPAAEESKKSGKYPSLLSFLPFRRVAKEYETIAKATEEAIFPAVAAGAEEAEVENVPRGSVADAGEENAENESGVVPVAGAPSPVEAEKKPGNGDEDQGYECVMDGVLLRVCNASE